MSGETSTPLPNFETPRDNAPNQEIEPRRVLDARFAQIPDVRQTILPLDSIRPDITQPDFSAINAENEGRITGPDNSGRAINAAQFAEAEAFLDLPNIDFSLDNEALSAIPDTGKLLPAPVSSGGTSNGSTS